MDHDFWLERWNEGTTPWHLDRPNPALVGTWDDVGAPPDATVFVPLCGRSVDMAWLAGRGHRVVGSELSEVGVRSFFGDVGLVPVTTSVGPLTRFEGGPFELWCGDLFDLPDAALADVGVVYDRAGLVALPPATRARYAALMGERLPVDAAVLLVTVVYDGEEMTGPPFSVDAGEIRALYGDAFELEVAADDDALERSPDLAARGLTELRELVTILRRAP